MKKTNFASWMLLLGAVFTFALGCKKEEIGPPPEISTVEVTSIKDLSVTCGGTITNKGGSNIVASGLCWSKDNPEPSVEDNFIDAGTYTKGGILETEWQFEATIAGLEPISSYYVRAYAANESGTSYGEVKPFKTKAGKIFHTLTPEILETFTQEVWEGPKEALVDGDPATYWHTSWSSDVAPLPHYVQINFSEAKTIGGFAYWHRDALDGGYKGRGGNPTQFDLQTSTNGTSWTTVWTSEPNLPFVFEGATMEEGNVLKLGENFTSTYFRIRIIANLADVTHTHLGELKVFED